MEEEDEEMVKPLLSTKNVESFRRKNFSMAKKDISAPSAKPARLDPLIMEKGREFFRGLEENPNIPAYLSKLKDYARHQDVV